MILERAVAGWLEEPRLEGEWFRALEELCLFSSRSQEPLKAVLNEQLSKKPPRAAVAALRACGTEFSAVNIFEDPELREALKSYSNWPTYPQLYVGGELVGGCDIVVEMYHSGELAKVPNPILNSSGGPGTFPNLFPSQPRWRRTFSCPRPP